MEEKIEIFLSSYFGASHVKADSLKGKFFYLEMLISFKNDQSGGYSGAYCASTWNDSTLKNDADLEVFDLLFEIDIKNGADPSKLVNNLCNRGAFEAVKVGQNYSSVLRGN